MKSLLALFLSAVALSAANPASNMKLAFSDEFDAPALDASKWVTVGEPTAITPFKSGKVSGVASQEVGGNTLQLADSLGTTIQMMLQSLGNQDLPLIGSLDEAAAAMISTIGPPMAGMSRIFWMRE